MDEKTESMISLFNLLRQANGLNRKRITCFGIDSLEAVILINLKKMDEPTQITLSEKFQAPKQTINNVIKNLKDKELIEMKKSEIDGRKKIIVLTQMGNKRREEILRPINKANKRLYDDLGKDKVDEISNNLRTLNLYIEKNLVKEEI